jgi:hypothetical protein
LDQVRKNQYTRLRGRDRSQKYTPLSRRDNLTWTGAVPLHKLGNLAADGVSSGE